MKVYLLNPPYFEHFGRGMRWQDTGRSGTLYYPVWLSYAAANLEQAGYDIRIVDAPAWGWDRERVKQDVADYKPDILVADSSFPSLNNDMSVCEELKDMLRELKVILVGPPTSQYAEKILQSTGIDFVARGEYDFTLVELANALGNNTGLDKVRGISYRQNGSVCHNTDREYSNDEDLDSVPFVSDIYKRYLNIKDYFLGNSLYPEVQVFAGRGCPFMCTFCSWPQTFSGRKNRNRSIANVLDEFAWIEKNLPEVKEIFLEDDTFTIDEKRVREFTEEYKKRKLSIVWACNARASIGYETMKAMKETNCRLLIVGYESGNDEILKNIKKGVTVSDIRRFTWDARRAGLLVLGDFIIGLPGETRETIGNTKKLIKELEPDMLQVSVASPFPGTEFYDWARANNYLITDDPNEYLDGQGHQKSIVNYPWLSAEEIVRTVDGILKGYYLSLRFVKVALRQIFRRNGLWEAQRILINARGFIKYVFSRK